MTAPLITEGDCFISRFSLKPERREEFLAMFNGLVENFRDSMGETTHFVFYGWSRPGEFIAIESWKSPEIVAVVRADPGFVGLVTQLFDCCSKPMKMEVFNAMNSDGSIFTLHPAASRPCIQMWESGLYLFKQLHPRGSPGAPAASSP